MVVHRAALGVPQGPFGSPRGSLGSAGTTEALQVWRPHRSARRWHSGDVAIEFGKSQLKKGSGNQQTMVDDGSDFIGIELVDLLNALVNDLDLDNDLPNRINDLPSNNRDLQANDSSLCDAACCLNVSELKIRSITGNGVSILVHIVLSLCVVSCLVFDCAAVCIQSAINCRAYFVCIDVDCFGHSVFRSFLALALAPFLRLRCPSRVCSRGKFPVCFSLVSSPQLCGGEGRVSPFPVCLGGGHCQCICYLFIACWPFSLCFRPSYCLSLCLSSCPSLSLARCVCSIVSLCHCLSVSPCARRCHCSSVRLCVCQCPCPSVSRCSHLSPCLSVGLSVGQAALCPRPCEGGPARLADRVCQFVFQPICPSVFQLACPSVFQSACPSVFQSACPSVTLSVGPSPCPCLCPSVCVCFLFVLL